MNSRFRSLFGNWFWSILILAIKNEIYDGPSRSYSLEAVIRGASRILSSIGVPVELPKSFLGLPCCSRKRTGRLILGIPGAVSRAVGGVPRIRRVPRIPG